MPEKEKPTTNTIQNEAKTISSKSFGTPKYRRMEQERVSIPMVVFLFAPKLLLRPERGTVCMVLNEQSGDVLESGGGWRLYSLG
eukprot:3836049-Amphidinium_carterae.1